jgi:peptidoglycan/xylan/chitin deacetylase (PgdA/CDA1 family)
VRRQDILPVLLYHFGWSRLADWLQSPSADTYARCLVFHDLFPAHAETFRRNVRYLKDVANVISLDDFFSGRMSRSRLNVVLTFDDGYKSWVATVVPILRALSMPATFFVSSGFIGLSPIEEKRFFQSSMRSHRPTTGTLEPADLKVLASEGFEIGGHTAMHCDLSSIRDESTLMMQVSADKDQLETLVGRQIQYFAYPSGKDRNPWFDIDAVLQRAGYRGAVTTLPGRNTDKTDPFHLRRDITSAAMPSSVFQARATGCADPVRFMKRWLFLGRSARRGS